LSIRHCFYLLAY